MDKPRPGEMVSLLWVKVKVPGIDGLVRFLSRWTQGTQWGGAPKLKLEHFCGQFSRSLVPEPDPACPTTICVSLHSVLVDWQKELQHVLSPESQFLLSTADQPAAGAGRSSRH